MASTSVAPLQHTISHDGSSVLALAVDEAKSLVFSSGSQSECIYVWSLDTFRPVTRLAGHSASILALELAPEKNWLFSASGDDTVRVWDTNTLSLLYIIQTPTAEEEEGNVGDVFSLKWSRQLQTLYMGCQNTSIKWVRLSRLRSIIDTPAAATPIIADAEQTTIHHPPIAINQQHLPSSTDSMYSSSSSADTADNDTGILPASAIPIAKKPHKFFDSNREREMRERDRDTFAPSRSYSSSGPSTPNLNHLSSAANPWTSTSPFRSRSPAIPAQLPPSITPYSVAAAAAAAESPELSAVKGKHFDVDFGSALNAQIGSPAVVQDNVRYLQPSRSCTVPNAHYGYVYALTLLRLDDRHPVVLASGSGDEDVKIWSCSPEQKGRPELLATLSGSEGAVLALTSWAGTLLAGKQGGNIDVWDLETFTLIRTIEAHHDDVLALCTTVGDRSSASRGPVLLSVGADGYINRYDCNFTQRHRWDAHQQASVLSCVALSDGRVVTGGSDQVLKFWLASAINVLDQDDQTDITAAPTPSASASTDGEPFVPTRIGFRSTATDAQGHTSTSTSFDTMLVELAKFISYKSVSDEDHREDARQCAHYLKSTLIALGAGETSVIPGAVGRNPLILSVFRARGPDGTLKRPRKRVLFYGHYDTISAKDSTQWQSDPWTLTGRDGYLYGRGASDNKGPILSVATAVSRLWHMRKLDVDVVLLIEGEEESGSVGFHEALKREKERIGHIDVILLSNSYWIDDVTPCLTMGMRGVIQATITVQAPPPADLEEEDLTESGPVTSASRTTSPSRDKQADVHSGVQGGAVREPMIDMLRLLSHLSTGEKVLIPDFYNDVRRLDKEERQRYQDVVDLLNSHQGQTGRATNGSMSSHIGRSCSSTSTSPISPRITTIESLMARWRFPSLSIHSVNVSGSGNSTVIPAVVCAKVSLRLVPDQDLSKVLDSFKHHVHSTFTSLSSPNHHTISVHHTADWWLGNPVSQYTTSLSDSISEIWTQPPLPIREGGSIPTVALLEQEMGAEAVHLPMGQSSDNAHLKDERISLECLINGRKVVERWLGLIAE
ncbi:unnamed protein product [Sympodiomycopsis kandeliae]